MSASNLNYNIMFDLPNLPYDYSALEPYIDSATMKIHHGKHHQGYINNLNDVLKQINYTDPSLEKIIKSLNSFPQKVRFKIRNNAGGHYNHTLFFRILGPPATSGKKSLSPKFLKILEKYFGSFEKFKTEFSEAAKTHFGSGWAWLCIDKNKKLFICSTANQDNPLMDISENEGNKGIPILGLDVWEHAYYLKYQNKRPDYVSAFWNVINWAEVEKNYNILTR